MRQNYQRIMSLLQSFIDKNRVNVSYISFIEPIESFHVIQKITKMSFNIPLRASGTLLIFKVTGSNYLPRNILVNTLESTSFDVFWPNLVHT
jgi:hypothetical protein